MRALSCRLQPRPRELRVMRTLQDWFQTPLGQLLAQSERELLDRHLDCRAGAHLLQIGGFGAGQKVLRANTSRQWLVDAPDNGPVDCLLNPEHLPFQSDSMDIVILVHSLEFSDNPHRVLREADRVLAPEGYLLVLSFNLFSLWGLAHALPGVARRGAPWSGQYFSSRRIRDWLKLLDMEIHAVEHAYFRPPVNKARLQERLAGAERWGGRIMPWFGAVHLTVAQKHVVGLTRLRPVWRVQPKLIGGFAQPTSRSANVLRRDIH